VLSLKEVNINELKESHIVYVHVDDDEEYIAKVESVRASKTHEFIFATIIKILNKPSYINELYDEGDVLVFWENDRFYEINEEEVVALLI